MTSFNASVQKKWYFFLRDVENFFLSHQFCPVQTPSLVSCPGTEPHLHFYSTHQQNIEGQKVRTWYLASSPELRIKKWLCNGAQNVFEIHKSYRNAEQGPLHLNEFYLLEWYRAQGCLKDISIDIKNLLYYLKKKSWISKPLTFKSYSIKELFKRHLDFDLTPRTRAVELAAILKRERIPYSEQDGFNELFHLLFLNRIENQFRKKSCTYIYDYPPSLRAYSKLNEEGFASRFEFYWGTTELANAFYEVNDPQPQSSIFEQDISMRQNKVPLDRELIQEMEKGMPECSGVALGLERLFMVTQGYESLDWARENFH